MKTKVHSSPRASSTWRRRLKRLGTWATLGLLAGLAPTRALAVNVPPTTECLIVSDPTAPCRGTSRNPVISADGRYVAFDSAALARGQFIEVFVLDRASGVLERVSDAPFGVPPNGGSSGTAMTPDGRFVAFTSDASNLVPGDTNGRTDVFVRDRLNGSTERVSIPQGGGQANNNSFGPTISADGRFVAFMSFADNLVSGDTNFRYDVFLRDRLAGTTERVSVSTSGAQANQQCDLGGMSADGHYVAFSSTASNLVANDLNATFDVFVRDRLAGTTTRVSVGNPVLRLVGSQFVSTEAEGNSSSLNSVISADGRYVAFVSFASNLVSGDTNAKPDIFVRDRIGRSTGRLSGTETGAQGSAELLPAGISADGRFVGFTSASKLVAADTDAVTDVYVRDRATGRIERVSGEAVLNGAHCSGQLPAFSADGRYVAFQCDVFYGPPLSGSESGIFLRDRGIADDVQLSIADAQVSEGSALSTPRALTFTVRLSAASTQDVRFNYSTDDGSARAGADYQAASGTATIPAGSTSRAITVSVIGDSSVEPNETMRLNIDLPLNATISDGQAVGTISNDDFLFLIGSFDVTPGETVVAVGERATWALTWTVPSGSWRDLDSIELRVGDGGSLLWLRFDETTRGLAVYEPTTGDFGRPAPLGHPGVLSSGDARVHLDESAFVTEGPASLQVTLLLSVEFGPRAVGDHRVEVRATDDLGQTQDFDHGATLTVVPRRVPPGSR